MRLDGLGPQAWTVAAPETRSPSSKSLLGRLVTCSGSPLPGPSLAHAHGAVDPETDIDQLVRVVGLGADEAARPPKRGANWNSTPCPAPVLVCRACTERNPTPALEHRACAKLCRQGRFGGNPKTLNPKLCRQRQFEATKQSTIIDSLHPLERLLHLASRR
eukprot:352555-Chlamydomonas_euryale.AAC.3